MLPGVPQKVKDCPGSSLVKHPTDRGGSWMLPPACPPYPLPHPSRLRGPGSTPSYKVEARLALAAIAPPATVVIDLTNLAARVGSGCCVAGEELVAAAG